MQEEVILIFGEIDITPLLKAKKAFDYTLDKTIEITQQQLDPFLFEHLRDGAIQRFEFTVELAWKTLKNILSYYKINANRAKEVILLSSEEGILDSPSDWLIFLEARNKTSHIYKKEVAEEVFQILPHFQEELNKLVDRIFKLQLRIPFQ